MFPEIDYDFEAEEEIEEAAESTELGKVPLYDFENNCYALKDGKMVMCDQSEAVRQWVAFLIKTKMDKYKVYDGTEFGTYIEDYIGYKSNDIGFVMSEIEREITEKAELNRAIDYVDGFDFKKEDGLLKIYLTVYLKTGEEVEVESDV